MSICYSGKIIGRLDVIQDGRRFHLQIRESNCLVCLIHVHKDDDPIDPSKPWVHHLICFFADEPHLKRCLKDSCFKDIFFGDLKCIRLNIFYKEMIIFAKYLCKDGYSVSCYYKKLK